MDTNKHIKTTPTTVNSSTRILFMASFEPMSPRIMLN
uniref:Uncharacterized protein n=1 Tax=Arundo donax TaxID=35708 RepID=A0A0A8Z4D6_ARUDO